MKILHLTQITCSKNETINNFFRETFILKLIHPFNVLKMCIEWHRRLRKLFARNIILMRVIKSLTCGPWSNYAVFSCSVFGASYDVQEETLSCPATPFSPSPLWWGGWILRFSRTNIFGNRFQGEGKTSFTCKFLILTVVD